MTSTYKPSLAMKTALYNATATWTRDLESLLFEAKSRFADVVWLVLDDPDERVGGVWGAQTLWRKKSIDLRSILGFARESNTNTSTESYREVWAHKAMIYSRASPGFHLRHFSQGIGLSTQSQPNSPADSIKGVGFGLSSASHLQHSTPFRYTVFFQELLDIYAGKGGLGDFGSLRLEHGPIGEEESYEDWRTHKLRQDLLTMWKAKLYSDTRVFIVSKRPLASKQHREVAKAVVFHAHAFILVSRSPYFEATLSSHKNAYPALPLVLTLPRTHFTPTSFRWIIEYIYTGTLSGPFFDTVNLATVLAIWRGALFLGIKVLPKLLECQTITMLHGLCLSNFDDVQYKNIIGPSWSRMVDSGGCQCTTCQRRLPRVLAFSMAPEIRNSQLERGALRGVLKLFGGGWCTRDFASLSPELKEYILLTMTSTVLSPRNALALLFIAEETLFKIDGPESSMPSWIEPIKAMIISIRDSIDTILGEETSACLDCDEWNTIRKNDAMDVDLGLRSTTNPRKLAIIAKAILRYVGPNKGVAARAYQAINTYTKETVATSWKGAHTPVNSVLQAHLHHLKAQLQNLMPVNYIPEDLGNNHPSDFVRSSMDTFFTEGSASLKARPASSIYGSYSASLDHNRPISSTGIVTSESVTRQCSSIEALDLASISTFSIYSRASSRTMSTDYGFFYTRRAYSDSGSTRTVTRLSMVDNTETGPSRRESFGLVSPPESDVTMIVNVRERELAGD